MKRFLVCLVLVSVVSLAVAAQALAASVSSSDENSTARLTLTMKYNKVSISGMNRTGCQVTEYDVTYTNKNSNYYCAWIDVTGGIHAWGTCNSSGGNVVTNAHNHASTWTVPSARNATSGHLYPSYPTWNTWHVIAPLTDYYAYGKAVAHIYSNSTGKQTSTITLNVNYGG